MTRSPSDKPSADEFAVQYELATPDIERVSEETKQRIKMQILLATSQSNAEILTKLRSTVLNQSAMLARESAARIFTESEIKCVHHLAQTYKTLATETTKEQQKYDLSGESDAALRLVADEARALLGQKRDK